MTEDLAMGGWRGGTAKSPGHCGFACSTEGESQHEICPFYSIRQGRDAGVLPNTQS